MMNFIAQSMRRFGLAPKNNDKLTQNSIGDINAPKSDPLGHMKVGSKWSYSTLEYPLDIQGRSDLGHYMMFYINVPINSPSGGKQRKLDEKDAGLTMNRYGERNTIGVSTAEQAILTGSSFSNKSSGSSVGNDWMPGGQPSVIGGEHYEGVTSSNLAGKKRTMRTKDSIVLYMPPQITENYNAQWKEGELGRLGQGLGGQTLSSFTKSLSQGSAMGAMALASMAGGVSKLIEQESQEKIAQAVGGMIGSDLTGAMHKADNQAINNFLEVMFTGIGHRKFSFTWKFSPKSADESEAAFNIINKFKFHMAPELTEGGFGRYFVVPSEFDLFYMFRGEENEWINKISSCVLINADVNYTPNQYQTFRPHKNRKGAPPTEIDFKLDFMETKLITKADIQQGF